MALQINGGPLAFESSIDGTQFDAEMKKMEAQLKNITGGVKKQGAEIENYARKTAVAIGSYLSLQAGTQFISDLVRVRGEFQKLEAVLTNSMGDADMARNALGMLSDYAAKTPFQLQEVAGAYVKLVNQGFTPTRKELEKIGDLAASTGQNFDQLAEAILDAQTGEFDRLKSVGIRAEKAGDQVLFTFKGVQTQVDFTSASIREYITSLGDLQGVSGSTDAISKTLVGQLSNLSDAWDRMLNEIGQSNEGVFSGAISAATGLVESYETVLNIIKVLVITYGTYRAALMVTNVAATTLGVTTRSLTAAQILQAGASGIAQKAMAFLNSTMLANPAVAVAALVAGVAASLYVFSKSASTAAKSQEDLNKISNEAAAAIAKEKDSLNSLVAIAKDETQSKADREAAMRKINALSPEYLGNLDLDKLKTKEGTEAINLYVAALDRKAKAQAVGRAKDKIEDERAQELLDLQDKLSKRQTATKALPVNVRAQDPVLKELQSQISETNQAFDDRIKQINTAYADVIKEQLIGDQKNQASKARTVAIIDAEIKAQKELQSNASTSRAQYEQFQKKINDLEAEKLRITGNQKAAAKQAQTEQKKENQLLEERKDLLQVISDMRRDAAQTGMLKEQSELDAIIQRYDAMFRKIAEFNEKAKKAKTAGIGQSDVQALERSRQLELSNQNLKEDAARYAKSLEAKKVIFERYEEAKKEIGDLAAADMYRDQAQGFSTYLELLQAEFKKVAPKVVLGVANVGDMEKYKTLAAQIADAQRKEQNKLYQEEIDKLSRILQISATYKQRAAAIEMQYNERVAIAKKGLQGEELKNALAALATQRETALRDAQAVVIQNGALYQKLGQNLISFNRADLKQRIAELKQELEGTTLTPKMKLDVESSIQEAEGLLQATADGVDEANKFGSSVDKLRQGFDAVASSVEGINGGLAASVRLLANVSGNLVNAASQYKAFKQAQETGDTVGQVGAGLGIAGAAIGVVTSIVSFFKTAKEQRKAAQADAQSWMDAIKKGEQEINAIYRERAREQARINDLKVQGLTKEKDLLEAQQKAVSKQYQDLFKQLQNQTAVIGKTVERGGFLGLGTRTRDITASLAGKSFEELEKLFTQGQLTGKAKELFEQLQKIKQEGVDIDRLLDENRAEAAQIFTGTTADSITDTIVDGFANGFTAVEQFADSTEDIIRKAMLNALKYQALEGPIKKLYEQFAKDAESGGGLDTGEVQSFTDSINKTIQDAALFAEQIQKATGVSLAGVAGGASGPNSLTGAVKGITEQQADLLAGQFGGLRITNLEMLKVGQMALAVHQQIEINTASAASELRTLVRKFDQYETGARTIHIT
ncbi:hypothetical protein SAMN05444008_102366 [Cnuella takakiae]|uniref:Tape measure domain-containing protein n=1 Tax=Cnuella takakiae TaxID=1302690 RepID=A0A1M4VSS3_9BACT|nr:hypothetical protein [Cnuella takakiae]OLY92512.1 hypothetical protein BUE76_11890 [Cnuella takakiae]SHE71915.1 hypothetical protein SAMN05444008_102366 [Cnuella takakiae]